MAESRRPAGTPTWPRVAASWRAALCVFLCACGIACKRAPASSDIHVSWQLSPAPASVGPAHLTFQLTDLAGRPLSNRSVRLEANMSHPGMMPALANARESSPGNYAADFDFTMAGDWFIEFRSRGPSGVENRAEISVPGVRRAER